MNQARSWHSECFESSLKETLLFGNSLFDLKKSSLKLNASIIFYPLKDWKNSHFNMF